MRYLFTVSICVGIIIGAALIVQDRADAKPVSRQNLFDQSLKMTDNFGCGSDRFLVAVSTATENSDRMLGLGTGCVQPDKDVGKDGAWVGTPSLTDRIGKPTRIADAKTCPPGSYVVGLQFRLGKYREDAIGAQPEPNELLADLQPVCRNASDGSTTILAQASLTGAENNDIHNFAWDGVGGPKSCPEGYAVTGMSVRFDNDGVGNRFFDARLTCDVLTINGVNNPKAQRPPQKRVIGALRPEYPPGALEAYSDPKNGNNVRFAYCLVAGNTPTCGQAAADAFCERQNHLRAIMFKQSPDRVAATVSLKDDQQTCKGECRPLADVVCVRQGF